MSRVIYLLIFLNIESLALMQSQDYYYLNGNDIQPS